MKAIAEDGSTVYLPDYAGVSHSEVESKVWFKAAQEGFQGKAWERLEELGWQIVELEVREAEESQGSVS